MTVAATALGASSASASGETYVDSDVDGIIDATRLDGWNDGNPDVIAADLDHNDTFETIATDSQQNAVLEVYGFDTDLDGALDRLILDGNEDGFDDSLTVGTIGGSTIQQPIWGEVGGYPHTGSAAFLEWLAAHTGQATFGNGWAYARAPGAGPVRWATRGYRCLDAWSSRWWLSASPWERRESLC